ncbi:MAG: histidine kinase [Pyrinomonadaceae bacterium]|nr:histidine kinase [Pyrinomonadaceae bacterium]
MNTLNSASLVNLLGFTVGVALYALLLVMVVRHRRAKTSFDVLLFAAAVLGLLWNAGELFIFITQDFGRVIIPPFLIAVSYSALGFLPSVVVHSAWKNSENKHGKFLTVAAYGLSFFAAILHLRSAISVAVAPSDFALQVLSFGAIALLIGLFVFNFRQPFEKKIVWASALLIFAVSALHLSGDAEDKSWLVELVAHQSSLPIAFVILLQDFRFAFADLFLKRALSLVLVSAVAFGLYVFVAAPLLHYHETHDRNDTQAIAIILTLWVTTALVYPKLHDFAVWLVDKIILRRANYEKLRVNLAQSFEKQENSEDVLETICRELSSALTAREAFWTESRQTETNLSAINFTLNDAEIFIPTGEPPFYKINLQGFAGGRKLLSDEIEMLEAVSLLAARRIDALRVTHERCETAIREQEFSKLATEAQLSALRAQINPHFLFNALTTVGYLINTSPDKAFATLMKLTQLLRGVLSSTKEFSLLEDEMKLIESYLDIERARFEERLQVKIEIPPDSLKIRVPSLILQPLVENAVKHGIAESSKGGEVSISARLETQNNRVFLNLTVANTGADFVKKRENSIGLNNVEQRLRNYYGDAASLRIESKKNEGTRVELRFPTASEPAVRRV